MATYRIISVRRENSWISKIAYAPFREEGGREQVGGLGTDQRPEVQAKQVLLEMIIRKRQDAVPRNRGVCMRGVWDANEGCRQMQAKRVEKVTA